MIDGVTATTAPDPARLRDRVRLPIVWLNLAGVVLVGSALVPSRPGHPGTAVLVLGAVALVAWAVWALAAPGRVRDVAMVAAALTAAVGTGLGGPSLLAPVIAATIVGVSDLRHGARSLVPAVLATGVALALAAAGTGTAPGDLLSLLAGLAIGVLGGTTRRQRRVADLRERAALEGELAAEREAERVRLLEARSAAARDVHDVLAHSLGGLVLQLDAIEALLERGHVDEAATRASAARTLAAEGLTEARRAVAVLRDPASAAPVPVDDDALARLVAAHRALGGDAELTGDPSLAGIDGPHREALARALQEALANARRHAPGAAVAVRLDRREHAVELRVANRTPAASGSSAGDGHGLPGMRERFAALGDGSAARAGVDGTSFVVEATAVLP